MTIDELRSAVEIAKKLSVGLMMTPSKTGDEEDNLIRSADAVDKLVDFAQSVIQTEGMPEKIYCSEHPKQDHINDCATCRVCLTQRNTIDLCSSALAKEKLRWEEEKADLLDRLAKSAKNVEDLIYFNKDKRKGKE